MIRISLQAISVAMTLYFVIHFLPVFRPYPYTDDWIYTTPLKFTTVSEWIDWIISQHVDHRIPLQKVSNYIILRYFSFDFRFLIAFNYALALLMTFNLLYIARQHRGFQTFADAIIPLICLEYAAGFTQWGFQFQFLFSMVTTTGFAYYCFRYDEEKKSIFLTLACVTLLASALSGVNGLISATWCTAAMLGWVVLTYRTNWAKAKSGFIALLGVCVLVEATIWLTWRPSGATSTQFEWLEAYRFVVGLLPSSMLVYAFENTWWKTALITALLVLAVGTFMRNSIRSLQFGEFVLMVVAGASLLIIASVSIGRAKAQGGGWASIIGMHYGYLTILLPIATWIVVSKSLPRVPMHILGLLLFAVFARAFQVNLEWRQAWVNVSHQHQVDVMKALQQSSDPQTVVDQYTLDFTWKDTPQEKVPVINGVNNLREIGAKLYMFDPASVSHFLPVAEIPLARSCEGSIDLIDGRVVKLPVTHRDSMIKIAGWVASDASKGNLTAQAFVTLKASQDGKLFMIAAQRTSRPDVSHYFNQPSLIDAGFESYGPLDGLKGNYTIGMAIKQINDPTLYACENMVVPVQIE